MNNEKYSLKKRIKSFAYAFAGLRVLFREEHNSWIHATAAVLAIAAGFAFRISYLEWVAVLIVIGMVFSAEILNSSLERTADFVKAERDDQTGKLTHCDSLKWKLLSRRKLLWKQLKRTAKRLLKRQVALALLVVMAVVLSACEGTPLGDGYYYTNDYPYGVCKRISPGVGEVVIPPSHAWTDTSWTPVCADIVVRVYWDDTTILAVSCYGDDVSAEDTTCWKLNKKSGEVVEITPDEMHRRTSQGKMRTDYIIDRYKK